MLQVFLNQLKEMLLHEGLDLFREGSPEKALAQISEAININSYMKMEGIKGHSEMQDRLLLERAVIKLHMVIKQKTNKLVLQFVFSCVR